MSKRYSRSVAVAAAAALVLTGCGGVGGGDDEPAEGGAVTLTTMGFGVGDEIASTRVDLADKTVGGKAKIGNNAFDAQQFLSAVASNNPPDLVYMDRQLLGTYAARGTLEPLESCVESEQIDLDQYRDPALAEVTLDDKLYGLPEFYNNRVLMVNDASVQSAGLTPDAIDPGDRDLLSQSATKLTKKNGSDLARIGFDPKIPEFLPIWAKANGVDMLSEDGKTANLDDPKLVAALEYAVGLIQAQGGWGSFKAFRDSFDFFGEENPFAADQLASFPMEDWYLNVLADVSPDLKFTVAPFTDEQGQPVDWVTGTAWAIPAASEHKEQACKWIKTMTDSETWIAAAEARRDKRDAENKPFSGVYTGNEVADEKIFGEIVDLADTPVYDKAVKNVLEAQESAFSMPSSPAGSEFRTAWQDAVNRVLSGQQAPAAAMAQAQQEAQAALDNATGN
ncbi:extracellular solute-binding protein [Actinophytocola xanthii]|uniref:Sugar ABC transporter substrate-binding protein n=1 Tax=Actinophytocola xanthii TaxID=1912961 RepID=A0A1Q8CGL0_9PSEU|nr:extracellular solute-binding protein [Actinophytocola xanthii]OLF13509.1 sugar ABC transporter substrate-binding protein [Actinophytocola xanthii]